MIIVTTSAFGEGVQFVVDRRSEHEFDDVPEGPVDLSEFYFRSRQVITNDELTLRDFGINMHSSLVTHIHRTGDNRHGPWCFVTND